MSLSIDSRNTNELLYATVNRQREQIDPNREEPISFTKELKDYEDKMLTGLTEEEWEELKAICKQHLEEFPVKTDEDMLRFDVFVKNLLRKYGFKGNLDQISDKLMAGALSEDGDYQKKLSDPSLNEPNKNENQTQVITETDGSKYLMITFASGQKFKIKLSNETDSNEDGMDENSGKKFEETQKNGGDANIDFASNRIPQDIRFRMEQAVSAYDDNFLYVSESL